MGSDTIKRDCILKVSSRVEISGADDGVVVNELGGMVRLQVGDARREIDLEVIDPESSSVGEGGSLVRVNFEQANVVGPSVCSNPPEEGSFEACVRRGTPREVIAGIPAYFALPLIAAYGDFEDFPREDWLLEGYCAVSPFNDGTRYLGRGDTCFGDNACQRFPC